MCGIVGMSMPENINPITMKALLLMAQARGSDATGIATPEKTIKQAVTAREFIAKVLIPETKNIIGHTRAGIVGDKTKDRNAHPFTYGEVTGTHNGYISNYEILGTENDKTFEVDSEAIFYLIDKVGITNTPKQLNGSYAVAYFQNEKLHLYRKINPIFVGSLNGGIVYGSTSQYLEVVGANSIEEIPEETLYVFKDGKLLKTKEIEAKKYTHSSYQDNSNKSGQNYGILTTYTMDNGVEVTGRAYLYRSTYASVPEVIGGVTYSHWYDTIRTNIMYFSIKVADNYFETYRVDLNKIKHLTWLENEHYMFYNRLNLNKTKIKLLN